MVLLKEVDDINTFSFLLNYPLVDGFALTEQEFVSAFAFYCIHPSSSFQQVPKKYCPIVYEGH